MISAIRRSPSAILLAAASLAAFASPVLAGSSYSDVETAGIRAFLHDHFHSTNACMVVGIVDERGPQTFSAGTLDNGTGREPGGDTIFFIGSVSKTFTTLLLQDMIARGEMKVDDSVKKFLPASVTAPAYHGKEITLFTLATHTAGLPMNPDNMTGRGAKRQYETYTTEKMYAFLSGFTLTHEPGTLFEYSNVGMALLGQVIALKAGTNFESLLVDRIARPLHMDDTCITLNAEQLSRRAMGHDDAGKPSPPWKFDAYHPAGDIHSTANDLLKYAAAQVGLTPSRLTPLMERTHIFRFTDTNGISDIPGFGAFGRTAMDWVDRDAFQPPGAELLGHAGGAGSYHAFVGLDKKQRRGVVVLTTANDVSVEPIGWTILQHLPLKAESAHEFAHYMTGLGFAFDIDPETKLARVTRIFPDSPGTRAHLTTNLLIQKIAGIPTAGKTTLECIQLFRANAKPKVALEVIDPSRKMTNTVEVAREKFLVGG